MFCETFEGEPGTGRPVTLSPDSQMAIAPALYLGADATIGTCEVRYDDIEVSVRD